MKIELFVNTNWKTSKKKFTHYWYNEGQNFFDSVNQTFDGFHTLESENINFVSEYDGYTGPTEAYLEQFKKVGYSWQEINPIKFQRNDMFSGSIQIDRTDFDLYPVLFLRVTEDGDTFPKYYYSESIGEISDQNFPNSYVIPLKMDMWATYWVYMHHFMKSSTEDVDFIQKMCNRFLFKLDYNSKGERIDSQGFIIDYLRQPYLMRTNKYDTNLVVNDNRANFLTLEEWLFINSGKKDILSYEDWLKDTWLTWMNNPYVGTFNPLAKEEAASSSPTLATDAIGKLENKAYVKLDGFYDTDYNSNTKYRYLVCKVGNNASKSKADEGKMIEAKKGMFSNQSYDTISLIGDGSVTCPVLNTDKWTLDSPQSYSWHKELTLTGVSLSPSVVCINWKNWLIDKKYLTLHFNSDILGDYYVTWTDDLALKSHRKVLTGVALNKEYSIIDLPTKSYAFDIYGDFVNVTLSINIKFTSNTSAVLVFRVKFDKNYEKIVWPNITVNANENYTINSFKISTSATSTPNDDQVLTGETLMLVPFKKGEDERKYITALNDTNNGICMGDGSVLGMPINDIPPSVLALAIRRQNDNSDWQSIGDALSIRGANGVECPLDLVNFKLGDLNIPVMFTSFDNIPITVASAPLLSDVYQCVGGNNFFNYYYDILTNSYLTGNTQYYDFESEDWKIHGGNVIDCEPFLYSPQFWKWSYFIDGSHFIELTGEKIDFEKLLINQDWEVKLNVNFNSITSYFLDISDIKNNKYPMTKLGMELINGDPSSYPFTTEAYNNWLQGNQLTQETAKNAKDITNEYVKKRGIVDATLGAVEAGAAAAGAAKGGFLGFGTVASKAITGTAVAGAHAAGAVLGMKYTMAENTAQFENKWRGELSNYYNSPSQLNPSGFSSGSLIYSPISSANSNSYELFRTFSAPSYVKERVWHDISINGYPFVSQCAYADYNNRIRFNVVNCNLNDKQYIFFNYLREKMFEISPMFSNDDAILTFMKKCQDLFRVFKCEYNADKMEQIISENIELDREWCEPYFAPRKVLVFENVHSLYDYQDDSWSWDNEYSWSHDDENYYLTKKATTEDYNIDIKYEDLFVDNWAGFLNTYGSVALGNKNSKALLFYTDPRTQTKEIYEESVVINNADYGPDGLKLPNEITKFINSIQTNDILTKAIFVTKDDVKYTPSNYVLGWNVTLSNTGSGVHVKLEPVSKWTFNTTTDVSSGTIGNLQKGIEDVKIPININKVRDKFILNPSLANNSYPIAINNKFETEFRDGQPIPFGTFDWVSGAACYLTSGKPFEATISYESLGVETYSELYEAYSKLLLNLSGKITFSTNWPRVTKKTDYTSSGSIDIPIEETPTKFSKWIEIIKVGKTGDESIRNPGKYINMKFIDDTDISKSLGGHASCHTEPLGVHHWGNAADGTYNMRVVCRVEFFDTYLTIKIYESSYIACGGNQEGYGTSWGECVRIGYGSSRDSFWTFGRDNNLRDFSSEMNIKDIVIKSKQELVDTKWVMENDINTVNFIKKDDNRIKNSVILKNKEGN